MREPQHSTHCSVQNQRVDEVAIFHKITAAGSATDNGAMPMVPGPPTASRGSGRAIASGWAGKGHAPTQPVSPARLQAVRICCRLSAAPRVVSGAGPVYEYVLYRAQAVIR